MDDADRDAAAAKVEVHRRVGDAVERGHRSAITAADGDPSRDVEVRFLRAVRAATDAESDALSRLAAREAEVLRDHERASRVGRDAGLVVDAVEGRASQHEAPDRGRALLPRRLPRDTGLRIRGCGLDRFEECREVDWLYLPGGLDEGEQAEQSLTADGCDAAIRFAFESEDRFQRGSVVDAYAVFELTGGSWRDESPWCLRPRVTTAGHFAAVTGAPIERGATEIVFAITVTTYASSPTSRYPAPIDWTYSWTVPVEYVLGPHEVVTDTVAATTATDPAMTFRPSRVDRDGPRTVGVAVWVRVEAWVRGNAIFGMRLGSSSYPGVTVHGLEWGITSHFELRPPSDPFRPWRPGGPIA